MSVLEDELDDLEDDLDDSEDLIGEQAGPLVPLTGMSLKGHLDSAASIIIKILDPDQEPSLTPNSISPIPSIQPSTLSDYARTCHRLAEEAHTESGQPTPDHQAIGARLKTIQSLLPGYRQAAGIT